MLTCVVARQAAKRAVMMDNVETQPPESSQGWPTPPSVRKVLDLEGVAGENEDETDCEEESEEEEEKTSDEEVEEVPKHNSDMINLDDWGESQPPDSQSPPEEPIEICETEERSSQAVPPVPPSFGTDHMPKETTKIPKADVEDVVASDDEVKNTAKGTFQVGTLGSAISYILYIYM